MQICEKPIAPKSQVRRSPRKRVEEKKEVKEVVVPSQGVTAIDILHQEWDDIADSDDISCNIQQILDGLSDEETMEHESSVAPSECNAEGKENESKADKLFPLFYKEPLKPTQSVV